MTLDPSETTVACAGAAVHRAVRNAPAHPAGWPRHALVRAALLAAAVLATACSPTAPPRAANAPAARPSSAPVVAQVPAAALVAVAQVGADPRHRDAAVRALLTNLIDDGDPLRFNDPQWPVVCAENSSVSLDGRPLEGGELVPAGSFTLAFTLDGACPLGDGGPLLFGTVRMLVVRDDAHGLVPVVLAPG